MDLRPHLILLHGALGDQSQVAPLAELFADEYRTICLNFAGHGKHEGDCPDTMEDLVEDITSLVETLSSAPVYLFGYSMGGYAAALYAANHRTRVKGLATYGTKWHWSEEVAARETALLNGDKMAEKVPEFAASLQQRHTGQGWLRVLALTRNIMTDLGSRPDYYRNQLSELDTPMMIVRGGFDKMVGQQESIEMAEALRSATYLEMPEQKHGFDQVDHRALAQLLKQSGIFAG